MRTQGINAAGGMTWTRPNREAALKRLERLVGAWDVEATAPNDPSAILGRGRCTFEWALGGQFLTQRTEVPDPFPDNFAIIAVSSNEPLFTQHYFDARGVARLYAMTLSDRVWTLTRDEPDFSPLDFAQRFTGVLSDDGNTIRGRWETTGTDSTLQPDFDLIYRRSD
jgi:hypothetical protein